MSEERRPLGRLRKFHKGKRGISQRESHRANLHREFRGEETYAQRLAREAWEREYLHERAEEESI